MFKDLKLKQKFTLALLALLLCGIALSGLMLSTVLRRNAQSEVTTTAILLMDTMNSVRNYTSTQIQPQLAERLEVQFLPQTVPAYSAREIFESLRSNAQYNDFFYKEATLNPTNLRDKADDFEAKIVEDFREDTNMSEISGFRKAQGRNIFYTARPLSVGKASCLECHSTPEKAPKSMIEYYGPNNGFGWKEGEIIGAQIISVPASNVINKANQATMLTLGVVSAIFALILVLINYLLSKQVVNPLRRMAKIAEEVSRGNMAAEFDQNSKDEVGSIAQAFTRMKRSLMMAMDRIGPPSSQGRTNTTRPTWSNGNESTQSSPNS